METQWSDAVIGCAARLLPQSSFDSSQQDHFLKLSSTLHMLRHYPDTTAQTYRFLDRASMYHHREYWMSDVSSPVSTPHSVSHPSPEAGAEPPPLAVRPLGVELCVEGLGGGLYAPGSWAGAAQWAFRLGGREATTASVLIRVKGGWRCAWYHHREYWMSDVSSPVSTPHSVSHPSPEAGAEPPPLAVRPLGVELCVEGLGGGLYAPGSWAGAAQWAFRLGGREATTASVLIRVKGGWRCAWKPIEGAAPEPRFSHSACPYEGGVVICGGLGRGSVPLGDTVLLRPTTTGFCWERLQLQPTIVPRCGASTTQSSSKCAQDIVLLNQRVVLTRAPSSILSRYSQCAHVISDRLMLVGGVWLQDSGMPGVSVTDLTTGGNSAVPWPLMLHSFCSELLGDSDRSTTMALIGGGGNCFSVGTHHNPHPITVDLKPKSEAGLRHNDSMVRVPIDPLSAGLLKCPPTHLAPHIHHNTHPPYMPPCQLAPLTPTSSLCPITPKVSKAKGILPTVRQDVSSCLVSFGLASRLSLSEGSWDVTQRGISLSSSCLCPDSNSHSWNFCSTRAWN
ncbi:unnamed protein product [Coregonus sp. 'balchen']|nr:unnamed protein product [Coregonus sp. 'balchen']